MAQFSVTGATGVIQFQGSDRHHGIIAIVAARSKCNSSDRTLVCYYSYFQVNSCKLSNFTLNHL
ncbi:MAG: hypothetical protein V7L11_29410 [Nostoc sp.]|uniref:hypothetical protein n=1 Tax=Nostoc sp. TaxID=1180 RepID=UPI002FF98200